jgi:hypothetical protein
MTNLPQACYKTYPPSHFQSGYIRGCTINMGVWDAFGNELDRADVSAHKLYDRVNYHRVMSSQYSIHHQIALVIHAYQKRLPHYQS